MKLSALITAALLQLAFTLSANEANQASIDAITDAIQHDLDQAEEMVVRALNSEPDNAKLYFLCGRIMGQQAENSFISALSYARKSVNCLKKSVELSPSNPEYKMGLIRFYLGAPGIAGGDKKLAKEQVDEVYKLSELAGIKAEILYLAELAQARELTLLLKRAVTDFPDNAEFHYRLGLQFQQQKQYTEAHHSFEKAATLITENELIFALNALYQVGRNAVFSEMNIEQGIAALEQFIGIGKTSADLPPLEWAHLRLAQLAKLLNNPALMEKHIQKALASNDRELDRIVRQLKKG